MQQRILGAFAVVLAFCLPAAAQVPPTTAGSASTSDEKVAKPTVGTIPTGAAQITGTCAEGSVIRLTVTSGKNKFQLRDVKCPKGEKVFAIDVGLLQLARRRRRGGRASSSMAYRRAPRNGTVSAARVELATHDEREDFEAEVYLGLGIDTFAAQEIQKYLNPEANGDVEERSIFGFDFSYRLLSRRRGAFQVWVYGETLHGVRSQDIDCTASPNVPSCKDTIADFAGDIGEASLTCCGMRRRSRLMSVSVPSFCAQHRRDACGNSLCQRATRVSQRERGRR